MILNEKEKEAIVKKDYEIGRLEMLYKLDKRLQEKGIKCPLVAKALITNDNSEIIIEITKKYGLEAEYNKRDGI